MYVRDWKYKINVAEELKVFSSYSKVRYIHNKDVFEISVAKSTAA